MNTKTLLAKATQDNLANLNVIEICDLLQEMAKVIREQQVVIEQLKSMSEDNHG